MSEGDSLVLPRRSERPDLERGSIFFVGTATVVIRYAGFTILTDPNFLHAGDLVHLGYGLTSRRRTNPALEMEDLPPLDFEVPASPQRPLFYVTGGRIQTFATYFGSRSYSIFMKYRVGPAG